MKIPLEMTFRGLERTDDIENLIRAKADGLKKICDALISWRVMIESPTNMSNPAISIGFASA
ncbi:MAG: hypothetical protein PVI13_02150 [Desulfobacterales bacterium]